MSNLREWYKSKGICPKCRVNDAFGKYVHCAECLEKLRLNAIKYQTKEKTKEYTAKRAPLLKQRYEQHKKDGVCTVCGKRPAKRGLVCQECWLRRRNRREEKKTGGYRRGEHFTERVKKGVCMYCEAPVVAGYCFCEKCLPKVQAASKKGKSNGASKTWKKEIDAEWDLACRIHRKKLEGDDT